MRLVVLSVLLGAALCVVNNHALSNPGVGLMTIKSPAVWVASFNTTIGIFEISVSRVNAPQAADRFYQLCTYGFYEGSRFSRTVPLQYIQFGIPVNGTLASLYESGGPRMHPGAPIAADTTKRANTYGWVGFWAPTLGQAASPAAANGSQSDGTIGPRTGELYINIGDNSGIMDSRGFLPFGKITDRDMEIVRKNVFQGYGDYLEGCNQGSPSNTTGCRVNRTELFRVGGEPLYREKYPLMDKVYRVIVFDNTPKPPTVVINEILANPDNKKYVWATIFFVLLVILILVGVCLICWRKRVVERRHKAAAEAADAVPDPNIRYT